MSHRRIDGLACLVRALMQRRVRVRSAPVLGQRWRQIRHAAVRRGIVALLDRPRAHRAWAHAATSFLGAACTGAASLAVRRLVVLHLLEVAQRRLWVKIMCVSELFIYLCFLFFIERSTLPRLLEV